MYVRRSAAAGLLRVCLLLFGLLVPACSTETVPTDPLEPASLQGRILGLVTGDGEPVSGITITLSRGGSEVATVVTTGNGEFAFPALDAGTYVVAIPELEGMRCSRHLVATVAPGEAAVVSFTCVTPAPPAPLGTVEGRVTVNGLAASRVLVSISDASRRIAWRTTADDGSYRFDNVPTGSKTVWIRTEEPCPGTQQENDRRQLEVTVSEVEVAVANFACTGQVITGHVIVDGIAQAGYTVLVCHGPSVWDDGCLQGQPTDSEGRYTYTSLRHYTFQPGEYFLYVQSPSGTVCPELLRVPMASGATLNLDFDCEIDPPSGEEAPASEGVGSVTIIPQSLTVGVYESRQLTAIVRDTTGAVVDRPQVTFTSIGLPAGTVDSSGLVTGLPGGCGVGWVVAWSGGVRSNTVVVRIGNPSGSGCWDY